MNIMISLIAAIWTLLFLLTIPMIKCATWLPSIDIIELVHLETMKYDRIDEVNNECGIVLESAAELERDDNRINTIKDELYLENGDWWQDLNSAPLLSFEIFDDCETQTTEQPSLLNLASFWVTDVNRQYHSNKSVYISGVMQIAITPDALFSLKPYWERPEFFILPNPFQQCIGFQGIYTESKRNHGERVMCLLGSTLLPSRQPNSSLLVLRFPRKFTLRSGEVRGIMKSMNNKSNHKYFDEVHISARLGDTTNYEFTSESIVSKACDPYPFKDRLVDGGIDLYKGLNFCVLLKSLTRNQPLTILSNWKCNGTDDSCSKFGPFVLNKEINIRDLKIFLQDVRCDTMTSPDDNNVSSTKIYLMLRAVPPYEDHLIAGRRNGVSNMTLFAEGIWKSSSGQLCMIGCSGDGTKCDTRICLYLPLSISLNQQAVILGTLSSLDHASTSHFYPLPFERQVRAVMKHPTISWDEYNHPRPVYRYSKIDDARVVLEKDKQFSLGNLMRKSLLGFPKIMDLQQFPYSLSHLANDLTFPNSFLSETDVALEIYFLGPLFGRWFSQQNISSYAEENGYYFDMDRYTDKHLLINVSGHLNHVPNLHTNLSSFPVEGIYDPLVGKMYLIGCQDSSDCSVEVVISYPPATPHWLFKPKAWISITSKRERDDPFYFQPTNLQTGFMTYKRVSEDNTSRRGLEVILSVLTLSLGITCVLSQLLYVRDNIESAPYVSLVMLGVQALGYSLPLITGAQVIFKNADSGCCCQTSQWIRISDYGMKLLALTAFLLTMRLFHKVWRSRVRMLRRTLVEPDRVPNEKNASLATLIMHSIGCILYLSLHYANRSSERAPLPGPGTESRKVARLVGNVEEYMILIQDLFLVHQIIVNLLWRIDCKPLRRFYYVGTTFVRLVPHIYYLMNPGYILESYALFSYGDIAMPVTVVFLGFIVYVQQRWSYAKLSEAFCLENSKFKSV